MSVPDEKTVTVDNLLRLSGVASIAELARIVGAKAATLRGWASNGSVPTKNNAAVAEWFGVSVDRLFDAIAAGEVLPLVQQEEADESQSGTSRAAGPSGFKVTTTIEGPPVDWSGLLKELKDPDLTRDFMAFYERMTDRAKIAASRSPPDQHKKSGS
jgi:hypothetical protein